MDGQVRRRRIPMAELDWMTPVLFIRLFRRRTIWPAPLARPGPARAQIRLARCLRPGPCRSRPARARRSGPVEHIPSRDRMVRCMAEPDLRVRKLSRPDSAADVSERRKSRKRSTVEAAAQSEPPVQLCAAVKMQQARRLQFENSTGLEAALPAGHEDYCDRLPLQATKAEASSPVVQISSVFDSDKRKQVAIKKISNAFLDATQAKMALREVMLLRHITHRNIVALLDIIPPAQRDFFSDVYIASDLIHTDMHKVIRSDEALSAGQCKSYLYQLLCGLKYLHSANILHRDLKPSNLLLTKDHVLKICDFGQSRTIPRRDRDLTKRVGTLYYKAPEILLHASRYSEPVEIWSVGCIFAEFMLKKPLFQGVDEEHQLSLIFELIGTPDEAADLGYLDRTAISNVRAHPRHLRRSFTEKLPDVDPLAVDLVEKMLIFDPKQRISVEEAIAHPYFRGFRVASGEPICPAPFHFDFEEHALSVEEMKDLIYEAALDFNPDFRV